MTACARPGNLDDLDLRGTIRMLEQAVFQRDALLDRAAHVLDLVLFKLAPDASGIDIAGFLLGGPFGIAASMWAYRRFFARRARP